MAGLDLATRVIDAKALQMARGRRAGAPRPSASRPPATRSYHVVAYDFGIKHNILRKLVQSGTRVTVVPALTPAEDVLALKPDGIFLSNGPGDPEPLEFQQAQVRKLIGKTPIFGICLGHQILGRVARRQDVQAEVRPPRRQSSGAEQGHQQGRDHVAQSRLRGGSRLAERQRGRNHARQSERPDARRLPPPQSHPVFCVQYHPEAAPGPHDSHYLFDDFVKLMKENKGR